MGLFLAERHDLPQPQAQVLSSMMICEMSAAKVFHP